MKTKLLLIAALGLLSGPMAANATLVFSDVQFTANSVSFTVDGDMTGYAEPTDSYKNQFAIAYLGDVWANIPGYTANNWSTSIFDNESITNVGNTGGFGNAYNYSWALFGSPLGDATANNRHVTLNLGDIHLNPLASAGEIRFLWGFGGTADLHTVVGSVQVTNTSVPEPGSLALLGLGLAGIAFMRRRLV